MSFCKESDDTILCVAKKKAPEIITSHELSSHDRHVLRLNMKEFSSPHHNDDHKSGKLTLMELMLMSNCEIVRSLNSFRL